MLKVIIVSGLPGSGKSTLAEALAKELHFPIFSVDPIESAILKSGFERTFETGLAAYLVAEALAKEQLKLGQSVIIDAVSGVQEAKEMWTKLSHKYNAKLIIIECIIDETIHQTRLAKRVRNMHGMKEVTWDDVEKRKTEYIPWSQEHVVMNTKEPIATLLQKAVEYINKS